LQAVVARQQEASFDQRDDEAVLMTRGHFSTRPYR
jgi:hypothetical protein